MTEHSLESVVEAYNDIERFSTISSIVKELDLSHSKQLYRLLAKANKKGYSINWRSAEKAAAMVGEFGVEPVLPGWEMKRASSEVNAHGETTKSWVTQAPAYGKMFEMPDGQVAKGISVLVNQEGREIAKWIKTRESSQSFSVLIKSLKETFEAYQGQSVLLPAPTRVDSDHLTVYPIADLHYGMRAVGPDGDEYNCKIADDRTTNMVQRLISSSYHSETAVILGLGDFFHINDRANVTPAHKHQLDVDGTYPDIVSGGIRLLLNLIGLALQKHQRIIVRMIPGNHDPESIIALTVALSAFYHNNPRVTIDTDPNDHWFYRFGKVLLGATHGHTMKPDRMAMMMATDCAVDWGLTLFKHMFFGHIHHESVLEIGPVRCESFNTPASKDKHAVKGGYRSGQSMSSLTFHCEHGEVERRKVNFIPGLLAA